MFDDRHGFARIASCFCRLNAFIGKFHSLLRCAFTDLNPLQPNIEPSIIHHCEHGTHAGIFGTD